MKITNETVALASLNPPSVWDFYGSVETAQAKQAEANAYNKKLEKHGAAPCYYAPVTLGEYLKAERAYYLAPPLEEISREAWQEALEVLPPLHWRTVGGLESFLAREFWSGSYTHQYVRQGDRYFKKVVNADDVTTWLTADIIAKGEER